MMVSTVRRWLLYRLSQSVANSHFSGFFFLYAAGLNNPSFSCVVGLKLSEISNWNPSRALSITSFSSSTAEMSWVTAPLWLTIFDFLNTLASSASAKPQSFMRLIRYKDVFPSRDSLEAPINLASSERYMFLCFVVVAWTSSYSIGIVTRMRMIIYDAMTDVNYMY